MKAVRMMLQGDMTQKQIAEKFGCSVPALQLWRKDLQDSVEDAEEEEETEEEEEVTEAPKPKSPFGGVVSNTNLKSKQEALHALKKKYWEQDSRGVDMLLTPTGASPDEVVRLINKALDFAFNYLEK